jgi:hypothetical protein
MIIIKTDKNIGIYLQDSIDGKSLRAINSLKELDNLNSTDYQIIKDNQVKPILDLEKAKQQYK